jgi:hypothetical protein
VRCKIALRVEHDPASALHKAAEGCFLSLVNDGASKSPRTSRLRLHDKRRVFSNDDEFSRQA